MSSDFYNSSILPFAGIIIKLCRAYTNSQEDFEDYYQEVCLQIWRSKDNFREESKWSTWVYRISLNVCGRCRTPININFCFYKCVEMRKLKVCKAERTIPKNCSSASSYRTGFQRKIFTEGSAKRLT
ncbi:RNA polymerase sigma factor [Arenibacter sp. TNZ]|uniref:sigma-70 family RNA polymerase sigma factor n=1 Tax=Arenibacter TaxID=178469 RepID=UPI000CD484E4|nr:MULTISPECIES: RNA polymerase sigma factor [Arenibacter]MCM4171103.1 RNA polymerase sigma factor [Arenibacter sp. TNZ]